MQSEYNIRGLHLQLHMCAGFQIKPFFSRLMSVVGPLKYSSTKKKSQKSIQLLLDTLPYDFGETIRFFMRYY